MKSGRDHIPNNFVYFPSTAVLQGYTKKHKQDTYVIQYSLINQLKQTKQRGCELIGEWQKSMVNHLYWSVASKPSGNDEVVKAKVITG